MKKTKRKKKRSPQTYATVMSELVRLRNALKQQAELNAGLWHEAEKQLRKVVEGMQVINSTIAKLPGQKGSQARFEECYEVAIRELLEVVNLAEETRASVAAIGRHVPLLARTADVEALIGMPEWRPWWRRIWSRTWKK